MKSPITEIERRELEGKIRSGLPGYGTPAGTSQFTHPLPEFFIGHEQQTLAGTIYFLSSCYLDKECTAKLSGGKGMVAVGYRTRQPACPYKCRVMLIYATAGEMSRNICSGSVC